MLLTLRIFSLLLILEISALVVWAQQTSSPVTSPLPTPPTLTYALIVKFNQSEYSVNEDVEAAQPVLVISNSSSTNITVQVTSTDISASGGGVDYTSGPYSVTIPAGMTSVPFNIPINDDNIFEDNENFSLTINSSLPTGVMAGNPDETTVIIVDNGSITVMFGSSVYSVIESVGLLQPVIIISNQSSANIMVQVTSSDISAKGGGMDYTSGPYPVTFYVGMTRVTLNISINNDNEFEENEDFILNIYSASLPERAMVGYRSEATVTIKDYYLRLVNGPTNIEGRVEVFYHGQWNNVYYNGWDINDAEVVCRDLSFGRSTQVFSRQGYAESWIMNVNCVGTELTIAQCSNDRWNILDNIPNVLSIYAYVICADIDECVEGLAGCDQNCTNTAGSYNCTCMDGYKLESDNHNCTDIDECAEGLAGCDQNCYNANGSYYCTCMDGYELESDNHNCAETDESNFSAIIIGITVGGTVLVFAIVAVFLCLIQLRRRRLNKMALNMKKAELNLNNPAYNPSIISDISSKFKQVSIDEWKKQLAAYLIDYNSLDIKETIASGKFGIVYKAYYTPEENRIIEVAVKTVKSLSSSTAEDFITECNIAKKFDHPNVLSLIGVCFIPKEAMPLMVMPYMHHGDVKSFVKSKRGNSVKVEEYPMGLNEEILTKICLDIAKGMEYLAMRHYVHRDLAARNCMLDDSMTARVADFGLSRDIYVTDYYTMSHSIPLPVKWLAPEALFDRIFSERTDVWAFGVTCWEVFALGLQPYPMIGISEIGDYIKSGKVLDKPQLSSDEMYDIMKSCWKFESIQRPDFGELVKKIDNLKDKLQKNKALLRKQTTAYLPVVA